MEDKTPETNNRSKFDLSAVITIAALVGLVGFGLGANFNQIDLFTNNYDSQNQELPEDLDYSSVEDVYDLLRENYAGQLSQEELMEGLKKGLVEASGDPFSEYLTAETAEELNESLEGEFSGIGAEIGIRDEQLVVIAPLDDTPAERAGLRSGDRIIAIDDEDATSLSVNEAVTQIRGDAGTEVVLTIVRGNQMPEDIAITRGVIEVPSVRSEMKEGDIGYIELVRFGSDTDSDFRNAARSLVEEGADSIILDVRNNPGGYLDVAVDITSEFLEAGQVVVEERRGEEVIGAERAHNGGVLSDMEVVVLVNGGSASASEIIAGALRDHGRATVVGEQTFGKGSVQELMKVGNGDVLRVTIAKWYTPNGNNINEEGITPDIEVERTEEDYDNERDPQLDRALELLQG